jgi:hypothetical protein
MHISLSLLFRGATLDCGGGAAATEGFGTVLALPKHLSRVRRLVNNAISKAWELTILGRSSVKSLSTFLLALHHQFAPLLRLHERRRAVTQQPHCTLPSSYSTSSHLKHLANHLNGAWSPSNPTPSPPPPTHIQSHFPNFFPHLLFSFMPVSVFFINF